MGLPLGVKPKGPGEHLAQRPSSRDPADERPRDIYRISRGLSKASGCVTNHCRTSTAQRRIWLQLRC